MEQTVQNLCLQEDGDSIQKDKTTHHSSWLSYAGHSIGVDIMGLLPEAADGCRYVLVAAVRDGWNWKQGCRRPARGPACQPGLTGRPGRPDYKR